MFDSYQNSEKCVTLLLLSLIVNNYVYLICQKNTWHLKMQRILDGNNKGGFPSHVHKSKLVTAY